MAVPPEAAEESHHLADHHVPDVELPHQPRAAPARHGLSFMDAAIRAVAEARDHGR
jgi:hypothetical protein